MSEEPSPLQPESIVADVEEATTPAKPVDKNQPKKSFSGRQSRPPIAFRVTNVRFDTDTSRDVKAVSKQDSQVSGGHKGSRFALRVLAMQLLVASVSLIPVAVPFGNPFGGTPAENWAYYVVYNGVGWSGMWIKVVLWNCEVWEQPFCFPFMQRHDTMFQANKSLVAILLPTAFAMVFYFFGMWLFGWYPVPLGTLSFGVPCFMVQFVCVYFLIVPRERRQTLQDHIAILRVLSPFVLFVGQLACYIALTWVLVYPVKDLPATPKAFARVAVLLGFVSVREVLTRLPLKSLMGAVSRHMGVLWNLGFKATYSAYCASMFPGMVDSVPTSVAIVSVNLAIQTYMFLRIREGPRCAHNLVGAALSGLADVVLTFSFLVIFAYNTLGPNRGMFYILDELKPNEIRFGMLWITILGFVSVARVIVFYYIARRRYAAESVGRALSFLRCAMVEWFWLVAWLLISANLVSGACMIMKHDGMDFTFRFAEWPFSQ